MPGCFGRGSRASPVAREGQAVVTNTDHETTAKTIGRDNLVGNPGPTSGTVRIKVFPGRSIGDQADGANQAGWDKRRIGTVVVPDTEGDAVRGRTGSIRDRPIRNPRETAAHIDLLLA